MTAEEPAHFSCSAASPITGKTTLLGVMGWPVSHSVSPAMHNAALHALELDFAYLPFAVPPERFQQAVRSLPAFGIRGVNCTIPHKEAALQLVDEVSPVARAIGAVNTIIVEEERLLGDNTDAYGFAAPLAQAGYKLAGKRALVLGSGGAARAVVYELLRQNVLVTIANRTLHRAQALAQEMSGAVGGNASCIDLADMYSLAKEVADADLLVNTTPSGMKHAHEKEIPLPIETLHRGLMVYDLVYTPRDTPLLIAARHVGCRTLDGLPMLIHQGAKALELWTGRTPPVDIMQAAAERALQS